ncbi:hypothetical protein [Porphyromonas levii]|uniref:Uncharacterized protein n=2 Tax=Porphyromonas levii TaxID=28114 RepID=A0A4Y8WRZ3_9PORP|nr:hypothetical protein [Porphyromonas levii]MBR8702849.1 hypothetical protein [Porphyromonas levii]MBR8713925.1 hypothetical protein [Porphyromonas levii]MBR8715943.1 hypothetical protein [Porphyromonas levii]MBR8728473.1 hypothetical protein [Porphyromonas levii]MBR8728822.1 hypothetical protein [Porphyromonas levii]
MTGEERIHKMERNPLHPFSTPEGYFESFKDRLMARIAEEEVQVIPQKPKPLDVLRPYLYIAAAIVGLVLVLNLVPNLFDKGIESTGIELRAEDMSKDQFEQFLLDDTTEDYWGTVLLEDMDNEKNIISSSR